MATELGKAYVQIIPSARGISGEISNQLQPEAESAGRTAGTGLGRKLVTALGAALAVAGSGKIIGDAINLGGDLEQNLDGTEAVFGEFADSIQTTARDAYRDMGLSASGYMATANKMGSLFQGSGIEQQRALELTSAAMQRAADVASVMGIDTTAAMESIAGAAKGNFTMMDNLGVAMNATTLQAYALEKGINFEWNTATNAEKSELAMKMFMDRTTQYAGNFARESEETFTGSLGAMKASWSNLMGDLATGEDIGPALATFGGTILTFAENLLPMITNIITQLPTIMVTVLAEAGPQLIASGVQAISSITAGIGQQLPTLIPLAVEAVMTILTGLIENIPLLIDGGLQLITGLAQGLINAIPVIIAKLPEIIDAIINGVLGAIPLVIQAGIDLLTALIAELPTIIATIVEALPQIIDSIITAILENIPLIVQAGVDLLVALIDNLPEIITTIVTALPEIISAIVNATVENTPMIIAAGFMLFIALIENLPEIIASIVTAVPEIVGGLADAFMAKVGEFKNIGTNLINSLGDGITSAVNAVVNRARDVAANVVNGVKNFFGIRSPSRVFNAMGRELPAGLAVGVDDNLDVVERAMQEMGELTEKSFESDLKYGISVSNSSIESAISGGMINGELIFEKMALDVGRIIQSDMQNMLADVSASLERLDGMAVYLDGKLFGQIRAADSLAGLRAVGGFA